MTDFSIHKNLILACHFTGIYDVNRNNILPDDDYTVVEKWAKSILDLNLHGIIFHNNFSEATIENHKNENLSFIKIRHDRRFSPNVFRYLVYNEFLQIARNYIEGLFITDVSDIVVLKNPFKEDLYLKNDSVIFCGDEPKTLDNEWMKAHGEYLRQNISDYAAFENNFSAYPLLNCGIIGGHIGIISKFIEELALIHKKYNQNNSTAYTGDMGAFNYLIRTRYNNRIIHGAPVNTGFKGFENDRRDCWFRHK